MCSTIIYLLVATFFELVHILAASIKNIGSNVLDDRPVDGRPNDRGDNHTPSTEVLVVAKTAWKQDRRCVDAFLGQTSRIPRSHLRRTRSWGPLYWSANRPWSVTRPSVRMGAADRLRHRVGQRPLYESLTEPESHLPDEIPSGKKDPWVALESTGHPRHI